MADACPEIVLADLSAGLQQRVQQLEQQLAAQRRTNELLLKRVAKSMEIEGGAFSLHEQNTQLQHSVETRSREIEDTNRQLRQEIAERKTIERALRLSEERYRFLMEESQQPLVVLRDFRFVYANPAAATLLGFATPAELIAAGPRAVIPPAEVDVRRRNFQRRIRGEEHVPSYEASYIRKDGAQIWCEVNTKVGEFEGALAIITALHDVTERKLAAAELARSNSTLLATLESTADGILVVDSNGGVTAFNEKFAGMWGLSPEQVGRKAHHELAKIVAQQLQGGETYVERLEEVYSDSRANSFDVLELRDGRVFERFSQPQRVGGQCIGRVWSYRDITERRRAEQMRQELEAQLRQAQKMEAIGTLAGGIAHDFNNILYAIQGYAELVMDRLPVDSQAYEDQKEVLTASRRAADLVRQILAFSRRSKAELMPVNVADTAREVLKLIRASMPATIELRFEKNCDSAIILADPTQVHQVLMNLCTNAGHAMGDQPGTLEVRLRSEVITPGDVRDHPSRNAGRYVVISVQDTGCGMLPEVVDRIFDPFFTTKDVGAGTGLGLSTVHGIVVGLGGEIRVESAPGSGTTFDVFIPQQQSPEEAQVQLNAAATCGNERVLLVDDEEALARMCGQGLSRLGYKVEPFVSSVEAMQRFAEAPDDFDLVITDHTMPQLTGSVMARRMLELRPDLPIILCTGYSEKVTPESIRELGIRALLEKPLAMRDLATAIRSVLDESLVAAN